MSLSTVNRSQQYIDSNLDTVLNHFFNGAQLPATQGRYAVDVREDGDHLVLEAELPGFSKDEVDITVEDQTLTISAEKKATQPAPDVAQQPTTYLLRERRASRFQRVFKLPESIDGQSVNAKLQDGILTVTLTKRPETKPRKIQVS